MVLEVSLDSESLICASLSARIGLLFLALQLAEHRAPRIPVRFRELTVRNGERLTLVLAELPSRSVFLIFMIQFGEGLAKDGHATGAELKDEI